jgi:hypothetical protein
MVPCYHRLAASSKHLARLVHLLFRRIRVCGH